MTIEDVARSFIKRKTYEGVIQSELLQFGEITIPPLTMGGYLELQIRNSPLFTGKWPVDGNQHSERFREAISVFVGCCHDQDQIIELISPAEAFSAWNGMKLIYGNALRSMEIIKESCDSLNDIPLGQWGDILRCLVRDLDLPISYAMNLPLVPAFANVVALAIKITREERGIV